MQLSLRDRLLVLLLLFCVFVPLLADGTDDNPDDDSGIDAVVILLFMFFGLGVGVFVTQVLSTFGEAIPYTVLVFLLGVLFSTAADSGGSFGESITQWVDIDAELLLFVFLPPLIFGEAMSLNWYHLKGGFVQSVILAGPGVLIGAALMGLMTKAILPYNWNWNLLMTFGSILSATDPVAVVALLKSVGASPKLTILIVGESLLNDGSAMVLFSIFYNALNGTKYTAADIVAFSFAAAIGSVVFGIFCGLLTVRWLRSANRPLKETDVTMQIAMTICSAYLTFFIAQYTFGVSGVLACCGAGAMLAWLGPPIILNHESMHNVWGMAEWALNTMIFLLAGLIIGHRVLEKVVAIDWFYLVVLYVVLMIIRAITILMLYPFISDIGHRCTKLEAVFMSWAGLRGALGMALALIVENGAPSDLDEETKRLFFYVGGIASLTLIINATTAKSLLYKLGLLTTNSAEKTLVTNQIKKKLQRKMDKVVTHMTKEFAFTDQDLEEVRLSCTLLQDINMDALYRDTERASALLADTIREKYVHNTVHLPAVSTEKVKGTSFHSEEMSGGNRRDRHQSGASNSRQRVSRVLSSVGLNSSALHHHNTNIRLQRMSRLLSMGARGPAALLEYDLLMYIRSIFLEIVRVKYWHFIEIGKLPRQSFSAQFLLYSIEVGLDEVNANNTKELDVNDRYAKDWICIDQSLRQRLPIIDFLSFIENKIPKCCADRLVTNSLSFLETRREKRLVYVLQSFIEAHEHAQSKIHKFLGVEEDDDDVNVFDDGNDDSEKVPGGAFLLEERNRLRKEKSEAEDKINQTPEEAKVIEESKAAVEQAKKLLSEMDAETVAGIRSKQAARMVLAKEAEMVRSLVEEGLLTPKHAEEFLEEINKDTTRIEKERNQLYREQARRRQKQKKANRSENLDSSNHPLTPDSPAKRSPASLSTPLID